MNRITHPTVLVVDDHEAIRQLARRMLQSGGYTVIEARDGEEVLAALNGVMPIDLLMTDLRMPGMDGDELAWHARCLRPDLKVLHVTGLVDQLFENRSLLGDGEAFLEKPFTRKGLLEAASLLLYGRLQEAAPGCSVVPCADLNDTKRSGDSTSSEINDC